jgi:aspartyl-tRNA(Asn)/glutamyl-tRNA(Gln) amidotransferase subunit C
MAFRLTWACSARAEERQAGPATGAWASRGVKPASGSQLGFSLVSQISRDEVAHLARLARLALTDIELDSFAGQLGAILTHVSQIQAVDVTGVEPTDNPLKDVNVTRPDEPAPCLTQQEALAEAPEAVDGRFAVPQILGESL